MRQAIIYLHRSGSTLQALRTGISKTTSSKSIIGLFCTHPMAIGVSSFVPAETQTRAVDMNPKLTPREKDVIDQMIIQGRSTREAASVLGITAKSVLALRYRIMMRFGVDKWMEVVDRFRPAREPAD
jgi:DNA-binding CsgD family transcriptional regulator